MTLFLDFCHLPKALLWCLLYMFVVMNKFQATKCQHLDKSLSDFELGENCEALLEHYASITANFTRCVIRYARPIMICQKCINEILAVRKSHDDILKLHEESGEACREELLNVDRLNVIESSFSFVGGQWKNAECEKCFTPGHEINSKTMKVFELYHKTENCLIASKKRNSTTLCDDCKSIYSMLNDFYNKNGCHEGFCMDVIDMMNTTRYEWSRKYNCSTARERPEFLFFTSSVIICMLPIFFYSLIWFFSTFRFPELSIQNRWNRRFRNLSHTV